MDTLLKPFDIRDYLAQLEPTKAKHKYECPVCAGHNLSVNPRTGAYQCWNGCETQTIRTAIAPRLPHFAYEFLQEQRRQQQAEREQRQRQQAAKLAQSLSIPQRDQEIRKVLAQLSLSKTDRHYLEKRGIPAHIITHCRTVHKQQQLTESVNPRLPGVNQWGTRLTNGWQGILVPFTNAEGLFVGMRLHDPHAKETGNGKYVWLSSDWLPQGFGPQLPNGELPLAVHYPSTLTDSTKIGLCEGPEWKAAVAAERLGFPVIGVSGNNFISSPKTLQTTLSTIKARLDSDHITLIVIPDAGVGRNSAIAHNHLKTLKLLKNWGEEVQTAWWGQESKHHQGRESYTHLDIDELPLTALDQLQYQDINFRQLQCYGEYWEKWLKSRKIHHKKQKVDQKYLDIQLFRPGIIHCVRSGMGTGKTVSLIKEMREELKQTGINITGYRNSLLYNTTAKASQPSPLLAEDSDDKTMHHLNDGLQGVLNDDALWFVNCLDSFEKLPTWLDENHTRHFFDDKYIVIDEVEAVLLHAFFSETLKHHAALILHRFKLALRRCLGVVCLDANLSDMSIEIITAWSGKPLEITENIHKNPMAKLTLLEGTFELSQKNGQIRKSDRSPWLLDMLAQPCFAVAADGQKFIESLEQWLIAHGIQSERILRIDGKTTPTKKVKTFLKNPDQWLQEHPNTILLYTTAAESGLDVSILNYFTCLYGFYLGVIRVNSFCQLLGRIRDQQVERKVWIRPYQFKFLNEQQYLRFNPEWIEIQRKRLLTHQSYLLLNDPQQREKYLEDVVNSKDWARETELAHELITLFNYEQAHLRECTEQAFKEMGYQLERVCPDRTEEQKKKTKKLKECNEAVQRQNCRDIARADSSFIGKLTATVSHDATWEERCAKEKAHWFDRLPGFWGDEVEFPDGTKEILYTMDEDLLHLFKYEMPNLVKGRELLYLSRHTSEAKILAQSQVVKTLEGHGILPWQISTQYFTVRVLKYLGIDQLLQTCLLERGLSVDMPILQELMKKAHKRFTVDGVELKVTDALGKQIPQSSIRLAAYLLGLVGVRTQVWGNNHEKLKIPPRQWQIFEHQDLLPRLDTAIAAHFSHLCRQIRKGNVLAILNRSKSRPKIAPQPLQNKTLDTSQNSVTSLSILVSPPTDLDKRPVDFGSEIPLPSSVMEETPKTLAIPDLAVHSVTSDDTIKASEPSVENGGVVDISKDPADNAMTPDILGATNPVPLFDFSSEVEDSMLHSESQSPRSS